LQQNRSPDRARGPIGPIGPYSLAMTRPGSRRLARPGGFATRIGFTGHAQIAPIVVSLALTPLLISTLGVDRFGIWSLALIALNTLASLDGGVSASLARFFAIHAARGDRADAGRLLLGRSSSFSFSDSW
jgi:hypothetical protein